MLSLLSSATILFALAQSVSAVPSFKLVQHASVYFPNATTSSTVVPVPGGSQLGLPVSHIDATSVNGGAFSGQCSGYSWTTTWDAGAEASYTDVEVRLACVTDDGVPLSVIEIGTGKDAAHAIRRITYQAGAPYEHLRSKFFVAFVVTPYPNMTVDVYEVIQ